MKKSDLTGLCVGRLVVASEAGIDKHGRHLWRCDCACGGQVVVIATLLKTGKRKSCGCGQAAGFAAHVLNKKGKGPTVAHPREYGVWSKMLRRCENSRDGSYADYGGRGIRVCERWQSFDLFIADMGRRPEATSLDRIDNDGHYEPSNCRWASSKVQARNRRSNRMGIFDGERMTVTEAAERLNVKPIVLFRRITKDLLALQRQYQPKPVPARPTGNQQESHMAMKPPMKMPGKGGKGGKGGGKKKGC